MQSVKKSDSARKKPPRAANKGVVSVVIPTYNRCELLERALRSVLAQSYPALEILVVDDGSTDGTEAMVASLNDPRIRFLATTKNAGGGAARRRGALEARGDYLAYLDSDDTWLAHKITRQLEALHAANDPLAVILNPPMIIHGGDRFPSAQPPLKPGQHIADYVYGEGGALQTSCIFMHAALGKQVLFSADLGVNQDTDFLLRLGEAGAQFVYLQEHLHEQDVNPRGDRISANRNLQAESLAWFNRVSAHWPKRARRGYFWVDATLRSARQGQRLKGLWFYLRGFHPQRGAGESVACLLRILGGGETPASVRRLRQATRRSKD